MKIINKILVGFTLLVLLASCKKQIDLRPTDSIDDTKAFQTVADLEKGLIGVYSSFGSGLANGIYFSSLIADETKLSTENLGQGQFTFKWQFSASAGEHNADYQIFYRAIDRANRILEIMDRITPANATETSLKNKVRAELLAFRGMAHYELLWRFMPGGFDANAMGVPIMLSPNLNGKPARNKVGEVVQQIDKDLLEARSSGSLPNAVSDGLRLSMAAVAAYQARVALLKRDWNGALGFSTEAITLSGLSITTRTQYSGIWMDNAPSEIVLRFRNNYGIKGLFRDASGTVFFEPSDKLKSQFHRINDIRFSSFFGSASGDTSIIVKYPGSVLQGPENNDIKAIRISEMYLIRAEANAELNQLSNAANDINLLRSNRISGYVNVGFGTKDEAIAAVLNERFKELAYEGFRFLDLKRRGLPIMRNASDVQSVNWLTLPANDYKFALPIPQDEIFANPNTLQNAGY